MMSEKSAVELLLVIQSNVNIHNKKLYIASHCLMFHKEILLIWIFAIYICLYAFHFIYASILNIETENIVITLI